MSIFFRPKGAYGTTDEAFVLILLVCLSQPDSNSDRLHTGDYVVHIFAHILHIFLDGPLGYSH